MTNRHDDLRSGSTLLDDDARPDDPNGGSTAPPVVQNGATDVAERLSEVLADVTGAEQVSITSNFFDDLGADSMVMAHFCARLSKRDDLPSVSIKEVYEHPTIASLALAVTGEADDAGPAAEMAVVSEPTMMPPSPSTEAATPVGPWQYALCGVMQFLTMFEFTYLLGSVTARGYSWISQGSGFTSLYLRSVAYSAAVFIAWSIIPIAMKWLIVGRYTPERFRVWSLRYAAFWFVRFLIRSNPLLRFAGSPIHVLYLRALGARIGRDVVYLSSSMPACPDLLTIGDGTVVRKDSLLNCYRAEAGWIQTGPISLGSNAFVGEMSVLDINTSIGDGAQLGHSSSLPAGSSIPDGEHRIGVPARHHTTVDYRAVAPVGRSRLRRVSYSIAQLILVFFVGLPLALGIPLILYRLPLTPEGVVQDLGLLPFTSWTYYLQALAVSFVFFVGLLIIGLAITVTVPRLLAPTIKPGATYPLYGIRFWIQTQIARLTNRKFYKDLFGDTSYILHYLRVLGYKVSLDGQMGANFGQDVKHENPFQVTIGTGTMAADGLSILNADYSSTSFRVSPVELGANSFLGNNIAYPPQGKTGDNCLHATKVMVPVDGDVREDVGFLGSPSFEIPRMVMRDRKFDDIKNGDDFGRRLAAKNQHNIVTMVLFLASRWVASFAILLFAWSAVIVFRQFGAPVTAAPLLLVFATGSLYYVVIERAARGFKPLRPLYCSMHELDAWKIERLWKLTWQPVSFDGTPLKSVAWRLLGVRIGRRLFDDGCAIVDRTLTEVGDDCTFNAASVVQGHSQEDGTFKSDRIAIGHGCTLGVGSLVHYGVTMGDGATLDAGAFLMKGTDVPPHSQWAENPAREVRGAETNGGHQP